MINFFRKLFGLQPTKSISSKPKQFITVDEARTLLTAGGYKHPNILLVNAEFQGVLQRKGDKYTTMDFEDFLETLKGWIRTTD
jgi:hypothetical protein